ncbi:zinc ABC transporter permease [Vibrio panuliri]|uniref:Zinc ABC transporter permease n=1 Tax=Vibrio panuliri TaxID=1381081 RepID=A0A1Q9HEE9_9VIBR|nr:DUF2878 domain-containing protein [Vibrio panuliri]OLQ88089.1 zinc ABC transporter permease [Vibrio panuliri]
MSELKRLVIVSTLFQLVWFLAVLGREYWQWLTLVIVVGMLLMTVRVQGFKWWPWLLLTLTGVTLDSLNVSFGLLIFDHHWLPMWLILLWAAFCWYAYFLTQVVSQYPLWLVSIVGGLAGAASYLAGYKLGAVSLGVSLPVAIVLFFIEWIGFVLLCMKVNNGKGKQHEDSNDTLA